jgi:hypothetical protein
MIIGLDRPTSGTAGRRQAVRSESNWRRPASESETCNVDQHWKVRVGTGFIGLQTFEMIGENRLLSTLVCTRCVPATQPLRDDTVRAAAVARVTTV